MRVIPPTLLLLALGCGESPPLTPAAASKGAEPAPVQPAEKGTDAAPALVASFEADGVGPLPDGRTVAGFPTVAVQGYGLRLELTPPFQATRMQGLYGKEGAEVLVVSWWDVTHPDAGKHGRVGLYNVGLIPGSPQSEDRTLQPVAELERGKRVVRMIRLGTDGSMLRFPDGHNALGGMGRLSVGPAEERWTVQVDDLPPVEFAEAGVMLHSWDPASGSPIHFDTRISQPYGDWPTVGSAPAPTPPGSEAAP